MLNGNLLLASLIWGSIGIGYWIYGKRQQSVAALVGGVILIVDSYFANSVLMMSLIGLGVMVLVYLVLRFGE